MSSHRIDTRFSDGIYTVEDALDRRPLAVRIAAEAVPSDDSSRIIGIFGGWGMGKTHLLRLVGNELITGHNHSVVRLALFPAWRYELEADLGHGLIYALGYSASYPQFAQVDQRKRLPFPAKVKEKVARLLSFIAKAAAVVTLLKPGVAPIVAGATASADLLTQEEDSDLPRVEQITRWFADLVSTILGQEGSRLVILIDDLDRCSPASMVRMFEWMKVHLDCEKCTFVVALDHKAAAHAVEGQYKRYLPDKNERDRNISFGYRYLDKLFQIEFELAGSPRTEAMVVRKAFGSHELENFGQAALEIMGADFPLQAWLSDLMKSPCLQAARTMLRVGHTYAMILQEYNTQNMHLVSHGVPLPRETPFWLLLLVCMQCTLRPEDLDAFVHHQDGISKSTIAGALSSELAMASPESPERQFAQFLVNKMSGTGNISLPNTESLKLMVDLVRQKVVLPLLG